MIIGHGDDLYRYQAVRFNFSSNIYSHADLSGVKKHLATCLDRIGSYPEPQPFTLETMLAGRHGIDPSCVMVTNGATEAIYLIARAFAHSFRTGERSRYVVCHPTFSEYEDALRVAGCIPARSGHVDDDEDKMIWLCNPNNPTGEVMPADVVRRRLCNRHHLHVIDRSYEDHTLSEQMTVAEGTTHDNLVQIHSMTKTYAIPGLRLGYITAAAPLIARIRSHQHPWAVNALAMAAGEYLLKEGAKAVNDLEAYLAETRRLREMLDSLDGINVDDTRTNFMLCRLTDGSAADLKTWLVEHHGILIRDASNFKGLDEHCFRIAAQAPEENDLLVTCVADYLQQQKK